MEKEVKNRPLFFAENRDFMRVLWYNFKGSKRGDFNAESQAKQLIREGKVLVNGETELRRGRKLYPGDTVTAEGKTLTVE